MKKVIICFLAVVSILSLIITGCSEGKSETSTTKTTSQTSTTTSQTTSQTTSTTDTYESMTLSYTAPGPAQLFQSQLMQRWMDEITKVSGNKISFKTYFGGSLLAAGATYDGVLTGAADIGYDQPSYNKGRFPVIEIIEMPWGYPDIIAANHITLDVFEKFQPAELEDAVILGVYSFGHPVLITNTPIQTLEDLAPLTIRGTGNMASMIQGLGAAAVSMPIMEVYDALNKGTVDGCLVGPECIPNWNFFEVGKYATDVSFIAPNMIGMLFMSRDRLNSLPTNVQDLILEVSEQFQGVVDEELEAYTLSSYDFAREHGMEVLTIEPAEQTRWQAKMTQLTDKLVPEQAAKGVPAEEIAAFIQQSIKDYEK